MNLKITSVRINPHQSHRMLAYAEIVINHALVVKDIRIIDGHNGRFAAFPSRQGSSGLHYDLVHPTNQETRQEMQDAILRAYDEHMTALES